MTSRTLFTALLALSLIAWPPRPSACLKRRPARDRAAVRRRRVCPGRARPACLCHRLAARGGRGRAPRGRDPARRGPAHDRGGASRRGEGPARPRSGSLDRLRARRLPRFLPPGGRPAEAGRLPGRGLEPGRLYRLGRGQGLDLRRRPSPGALPGLPQIQPDGGCLPGLRFAPAAPGFRPGQPGQCVPLRQRRLSPGSGLPGLAAAGRDGRDVRLGVLRPHLQPARALARVLRRPSRVLRPDERQADHRPDLPLPAGGFRDHGGPAGEGDGRPA